MSTSNVWTIEQDAESALNLKEGSYAANFGFLCEQSVIPEHVIEAAEAFKKAGCGRKVYSQAGLIVAAQEEGLCFGSWSPLKIC